MKVLILFFSLWLGVSSSEEAGEHNQTAISFHKPDRCLAAASREYARVLEFDPPRWPTEKEFGLARKFIPKVYVVPKEFFELKDFAAIIHPEKPLITYHFFWEDDIDFPEDNDPCDHEVVWVEYQPDEGELVNLYTYYHSWVLTSGELPVGEDRPVVYVQWGKHGSLPVDWQSRRGIRKDMEATYKRLHEDGRVQQDFPLARGWPKKFAGSWEDFIDFSKFIDPLELLEKNKMVMVSRWNNAVIDRYFLFYNFYPKIEWPFEE